jgi:hypothetical protein
MFVAFGVQPDDVGVAPDDVSVGGRLVRRQIPGVEPTPVTLKCAVAIAGARTPVG